MLGQALIPHDLRTDPRPDLAAFAAMFPRSDVSFTDPETAIRGPQAKAATRQGVFLHSPRTRPPRAAFEHGATREI